MKLIKLRQNNMGNIKKKSLGLMFQIKTRTGAVVKTTRGYWKIITHIKHPSMIGKERSVKKTLSGPDEIRISKKDSNVYLFYRKYGSKFLCVVTNISDKKQGFIITSYYTKKIKGGEVKWKK